MDGTQGYGRKCMGGTGEGVGVQGGDVEEGVEQMSVVGLLIDIVEDEGFI